MKFMQRKMNLLTFMQNFDFWSTVDFLKKVDFGKQKLTFVDFSKIK
jgi:hypothetical protein